MPSNLNASAYNFTGSFVATGSVAWHSQGNVYRNDGYVILRDAKGTELPYRIQDPEILMDGIILDFAGLKMLFYRTSERDQFGRTVYVERAPAVAPEPVAQRRQIKLGGDV